MTTGDVKSGYFYQSSQAMNTDTMYIIIDKITIICLLPETSDSEKI